VITAAGRGTRQYPATATFQKEMIPLVDRDGVCKPAIQLIVEEALESGIEQICIVVSPGGELVFQRHFRELSEEESPAFAGKRAALDQSAALGRMGQALSYALQPEPAGFGDAVYCAREFIGNQSFLLLLGDHVYLSGEERRCARQLLDQWDRFHCPISGVARTPEEQLHLFGTIAGEPLAQRPGVYEARELYEKPSPEYAREHLRTPGLPEGEYLGFLGMHVFTPDIFDCLAEQRRENRRERGEFQLTTAQEALRQRGCYLAAEVCGTRHDMGTPEGLVETQVALALHSELGGVVRNAVREAEQACG
jgi:UTP--glucose-1-phosphate uridylyltransferase